MFKIMMALVAALLLPNLAVAAEAHQQLDLTNTVCGWITAGSFIIALILVMLEEKTHLRKSKPMILAAGVSWVAIVLCGGLPKEAVEHVINESLLDAGKLWFFLIPTSVYINALAERNAFEALRAWLVGLGLGLRGLFWITGILAFFISSFANNMSTAILMMAVIMAVGKGNRHFIALSCISTVVAVNAGGAFSPFGDVTTLFVWQAGKVDFAGFLVLFAPAVVNWLVPAVCISLAIPKAEPAKVEEVVPLKRGARRIALLFVLAIATAVAFDSHGATAGFGMMFSLFYLGGLGYYLKLTHPKEHAIIDSIGEDDQHHEGPFEVFEHFEEQEWDTLTFFFGIVMCVGALKLVSFIDLTASLLYGDGMSFTAANILVGVVSSFVDNVPVMMAVVSMNPDMGTYQWLLVTLTAGVGGSLLAIGSAAGVALLGQCKGVYTFGSHLKWTPAIAAGYAASIWVHYLING